MNKSFSYDDYFTSNLSYYEEVNINQFKYNPLDDTYTYPCPCGDVFMITEEEVVNKETIARCNSCSLIVLVKYN